MCRCVLACAYFGGGECGGGGQRWDEVQSCVRVYARTDSPALCTRTWVGARARVYAEHVFVRPCMCVSM